MTDSFDGEQLRENNLTPKPHQWRVSPNEGSSYAPDARSQPKTPEARDSTPIPQPPNAPKEQPPRYRIRRRRMNAPPAESLDRHFPCNDQPLPSIEFSQALLDSTSELARPVTPTDHGRLSPMLPATTRFFSHPKTPVSQIDTSFGSHYSYNRQWTPIPRLDISNLERPSSALSDSSVSSTSSSDTAPSFGGSCTSPESDTTDPFSFPESITKPSGLASPVHLQPTSKPRKRLKTTHQVKWTPEMDEHLWMTYLAYQTNPEITPFKALPGVAPPLGVCHRVARDAKRNWKGPRMALQSISENPLQPFESIDALMRETSAPPQLNVHGEASDTIRLQPLLRPRSSNDYARKSSGTWPRSEASTRKRLRELCKSKPNLPAHYQRLMQTRSPSPFGSSSSTMRPSSRVSPSRQSRRQDSSFPATDDLKISLTADTMSSMRRGAPLFELTSGPAVPTPQQHYNTWSSPSTSRSVHQKSQSLPFGPSTSAYATVRRSQAPLASPLRMPNEDPFLSWDTSASNLPQVPAITSVHQRRLEEPWQIHAPRPMSGSMKRRADFDLGEDLTSPVPETGRGSLQDLFPSTDTNTTTSEGHKRPRMRGFTVGALRHASGGPQRQSSTQLTDLFANPPSESQAVSGALTPEPYIGPSLGNMVGLGRLAPPSVFRQPRLGSPFSPVSHANTGLSNTFPRSLFPHGLGSISHLEHQRQQPVSMFGSDGSNDGDNLGTPDASHPK